MHPEKARKLADWNVQEGLEGEKGKGKDAKSKP